MMTTIATMGTEGVARGDWFRAGERIWVVIPEAQGSARIVPGV